MRSTIGGIFLSFAATVAEADQTLLTVSNGIQGGVVVETITHNGGLEACKAIALVNNDLLQNQRDRHNSGVSAVCFSQEGTLQGAFVCEYDSDEGINVCRPIELSRLQP